MVGGGEIFTTALTSEILGEGLLDGYTRVFRFLDKETFPQSSGSHLGQWSLGFSCPLDWQVSLLSSLRHKRTMKKEGPNCLALAAAVPKLFSLPIVC